jgi:hypothetical protein
MILEMFYGFLYGHDFLQKVLGIGNNIYGLLIKLSANNAPKSNEIQEFD